MMKCVHTVWVSPRLLRRNVQHQRAYMFDPASLSETPHSQLVKDGWRIQNIYRRYHVECASNDASIAKTITRYHRCGDLDA